MTQPELRKMFPKSMDEQYKKILDTIGIIVAQLDRLESLTKDIIALAQRHAGYGVKPEHYRMVGHALFWTLQRGLGSDWTPEAEQA
jgi:hemoglobin-like flavoprotein